VTGIDRKVFLRALSWLWDRVNRRIIDGDMTEWSLWHLPSLVVWLAVDTAILPRTPVLSYRLFFSWSYNWKLTPITCSEWLAPSISKCPGLLRLESLFERSFIEFSWSRHKRKTSNHSNSLLALEQQRERWWEKEYFCLFYALEYFIRIIKQWYNKRKETKKTSKFPKIVRVK